MTGLEEALLMLFREKDYRKFILYFTKWIANRKEESLTAKTPPPKGSLFQVIDQMERLTEQRSAASFASGLRAIVGKERRKRPSRRGNVEHFKKPETGAL